MKRKYEKFLLVNPRGALFKSSFPEDRPEKPTEFTPFDHGFKPGQWIGLVQIGDFKYRDDFGDVATSLYFSRNGEKPEPLTENMEVLYLGKKENWRFSPKDVFYKDNSDPNKNYGVVLSYLNSKPPHSTNNSGYKHFEFNFEDDEAVDPNTDSLEMERRISTDVIPEANLSKVGLFDATESRLLSLLQYRGWYASNSWRPAWSEYRGGRPSSTHHGVDLFSTVGTQIYAPIDGVALVNPFRGGAKNSSFGQAVVLLYTKVKRKKKKKKKKVKHYAIFSHLNSTLVKNNQIVRAGAPIGTVGCSGNASKNLPCGDYSTRNDYGGFSDHLHIEIRLGELGSYRRVDPIRELGLNVSHPP